MKRKGLYQIIEATDYYKEEDLKNPNGKGDFIPVPLDWIGTPTNVHFGVVYAPSFEIKKRR